MLALEAGPQAEGHKAAAANGDILTGPAPTIKNKTLFGDFVVCQVKVSPIQTFSLTGDHVVTRVPTPQSK